MTPELKRLAASLREVWQLGAERPWSPAEVRLAKLLRAIDDAPDEAPPAPSFTGPSALDALASLRSAVRKVHAWRETGRMVEFDAAEQAAWTEATRG